MYGINALSNIATRGIAAHKAGALKEAGNLYRAILNIRKNHPDEYLVIGLFNQ